MDANKIRIAVTTEGRLFFVEDNPEIFGFMYDGETIKKRFLTVLPEELLSFFKDYSLRFNASAVNYFKNAFVSLLNIRIKKKLNFKFSNGGRVVKCNDITGDLIKQDLLRFNKDLYKKLMHIILNISGTIIRSFKKDFTKSRKIKRAKFKRNV